jgi:hypothetical protein
MENKLDGWQRPKLLNPFEWVMVLVVYHLIMLGNRIFVRKERL